MIAVLLASAAHAGAFDALFAEPRQLDIPRYEGTFDGPPAFHYRRALPGGRMNSANHAEWSDPLIHGPYIYVGSAAGSGLYALSRADGTVQRTYPASTSVEAHPNVVGDRLYFSDTGGNTYCYSLDGELLWEHDGKAPVLVAPTVSDDGQRVIVTNVDDLAVSLDAATGALAWQYRAKRDLTRQAELSLFAAPRAVIADDDVILGFSNGTLVAVDLETGEEQWMRTVGEGRYPDLVADPVSGGSDLYTSGYFRPLVAIDLPTHNVRWRVDAGAAHPVAIEGARWRYGAVPSRHRRSAPRRRSPDGGTAVDVGFRHQRSAHHAHHHRSGAGRRVVRRLVVSARSEHRDRALALA